MPQMPGRPKEFDRKEVLSNATEMFWAKGYQAASTGDLEGGTGLGRQSIYNEFDDKKGIFLAAVKHCEQT
jgi:TetR/AcrR family transcriptional repressor of nem operon